MTSQPTWAEVRTSRLAQTLRSYAKCAECEREFNLFDEVDAEEWYYGHDCE